MKKFNDIRFYLIYPSRNIWQKRFFPIIKKKLDTTDFIYENDILKMYVLKFWISGSTTSQK